ncbi:hypothetical protein [Nocardiopsis sp. L17-MgMaSL7]|nr:hypothetical protein [Nocardiopsis sp. L17-MgMaSL7]PWV44555.1 hypothetical protein BDW27_12314 [Nocardiopsis sp. L17-MgMaSL7]
MLIDLIAVAALLLWAAVTLVLLARTDHAEAHPVVRPRPAPTARDQEGPR